MTAQTVTDAGIGSSAIINAGGGVLVQASHESANGSRVHGLAFTGAVGAATLAGQVVVITDTSSQKAHIDSGAAVAKAGGGIVVTAHANRDESALAIGVGLGAGAVGVGIAVMDAHGGTLASIGDVSIGVVAPVASLTVNADADISPTATVYSVQGGVGLGIGGAVALTSVDGTTRAESAAHGPVGAGSTSTYCGGGSTGVCINALGKHGDVTANSLNFSSGAFSAGLTKTTATDDRSTEAVVTGGSISTTGAYKVEANATNVATATAPGLSVGGLSISAMLPTATVSGHTLAELDGAVAASASVDIHAIAENHAKADAEILNVSLVGLSGAYADAEVTSGAYVQAKATGSITSSGEVDVTADLQGPNLRNEAIAIANGITAPGFVAAGLFAAKGIIGGAVIAELDGNVTTSSKVSVKATGANHVEAKTLTVAAGLAGFGASIQIAQIQSTAVVEAISVDGDNNQSINSSGLVEFTAKSDNYALAHTDAAAGGALIGFAFSVPTAEIGGGTTASVEGNVAAGSAGVTVKSTSNNQAIVEVLILSIGGLGSAAVNVADAEITSAAVTDAVVATNSSVSAPGGPVKLLATSTNSAQGTTTAVGAGLGASVSIQKSVATVAGRTKAEFTGTIPTTGTKTGSLLVQTRGSKPAITDTNVLTISLGLSGTGVLTTRRSAVIPKR